MSNVNQKMAWLLSKPFVDVKYTDAVEKTLREMVTRIQNRLARNIDNIDWMTDRVKVLAKNKVEAITPKLGYPRAVSTLMRAVLYPSKPNILTTNTDTQLRRRRSPSRLLCRFPSYGFVFRQLCLVRKMVR